MIRSRRLTSRSRMEPCWCSKFWYPRRACGMRQLLRLYCKADCLNEGRSMHLTENKFGSRLVWSLSFPGLTIFDSKVTYISCLPEPEIKSPCAIFHSCDMCACLCLNVKRWVQCSIYGSYWKYVTRQCSLDWPYEADRDTAVLFLNVRAHSSAFACHDSDFRNEMNGVDCALHGRSSASAGW